MIQAFPKHKSEHADSPLRLIEQKLSAPRIGFPMHERPALCEKLLELGRFRFVLLSAPAGYGKTSLMCKYQEYLRASGEKTAWLSLDSSDNDTSRLRQYVHAAVFPSAHRMPNDAPWPAPGVDIGSCTLFIDDVHVLENDAASVLRTLLTELLPPQVRFVLGSRNSNPLKLSVLRNKGRLAEIDRADLSFTPMETRAYLQRQFGDGATESFIDSMHRHTEGWPAALQLACVSLRQRGICSGVAIEGVLPDLKGMAAFLTDEVFKTQPPELQSFLLDIAVVNQFSASLCDALGAGADSKSMIEMIFDAGIPAQQLEAGWYQMHPIFSGHLRALSRKHDPKRFSANGRLAAAWLADDGRAIDAVETLLTSGNDGEAVRLMERLARPLIFNGLYRTAVRWCSRLPVEMVLSRPLLASTYTMCLGVCNRIEDALLWTRHCRERSTRPDADPQYARTVELIRLFTRVTRGEPEQMAACIPALEQAMQVTAHFARGSLFNLRSYVHLAAGEYAEAERCNVIAKRIFREEGHSVGMADTHYLEAIAASAQGRLREAIGYLEAISLLTHQNKRSPPGYLHVMCGGFLAALHYELNELQLAELCLVRDRYEFDLPPASDSLLCGTFVGFRLALLHGRLPEAFALLESRLAAVQVYRAPRIAAALELELARHAIVNQQHTKIEAYGAQILAQASSFQVSPYMRPSEEIEGAGIAHARLLLHSGLPGEGAALIDALLANAIAGKRCWRAAKLRILRVIAQDKLGNDAEVVLEIARAVELGASMGLVRSFLDEGDAFVKCLRAYGAGPRRKDLTPAAQSHLANLLRISDAEHSAHRQLPAADFSKKEMQIFDQLALGCSNKAIASALSISINTVKWHLAHIYEKLGAANRSQAVFIARKRGLIE